MQVPVGFAAPVGNIWNKGSCALFHSWINCYLPDLECILLTAVEFTISSFPCNNKKL